MRRLGTVVALLLIGLFAVGFGIAMLMDASGWFPSPSAIAEFHSLPMPLRVVIEIVIGVPIVMGALAYFVVETLDMGWFITRPFRWMFHLIRRAALDREDSPTRPG